MVRTFNKHFEDLKRFFIICTEIYTDVDTLFELTNANILYKYTQYTVLKLSETTENCVLVMHIRVHHHWKISRKKIKKASRGKGC